MNKLLKIKYFSTDIKTLQSYILILIGAFIPLSTSISTILIGLLFLLFLSEGKFREKLSSLKHNMIIISPFTLFFLIHPISLLWSDNLDWGLFMTAKEWRILLPILFIPIVKKEHISYYILSFLFAMTLSEVFSYLIWLEIISPFKGATVQNPTPFVGHISYNPFLFTI